MELVRPVPKPLTSRSAYQGDEAEAYFDALEYLLRASNADVGRMRKELEAKNDVICDWESREAAVANEEETFEQAIEGLRNLEPFWTKAYDQERTAHEDTKAELANSFAAGQQKGRKECLKAVQESIRSWAFSYSLTADASTNLEATVSGAILALPKVGE